MGNFRQIDYIFVDLQIHVFELCATSILSSSSDHRAVQAELQIVEKKSKNKQIPHERIGKSMKGWKPPLDENENASAYHEALDNKLELENPQCLEDLRHIMKCCATSFEEKHAERDHPWMTQEIHMLINRRRGESNRHIRRDISKKIQQKMRQAIRKYKDQQIDQVLEEFEKNHINFGIGLYQIRYLGERIIPDMLAF